MQDKSAELFSIVQRLEKLRVLKQLTWIETAELLGLSDSMLYQVRRGDKQMSDKAIHRLELAEQELSEKLHTTAPSSTDSQNRDLKEDEVEYGDKKEPGLKEALQALNTALDMLKILMEREGKNQP